MPNIHLNYMAIAIAVVANFVLGFIWYTPLFGKAWAREMKMDTTQKPPASALIKGMVAMIIGNFLMAFVFAHNIAAWDPRTWGVENSGWMSPSGAAFNAALFTWIGFFVPTDLGTVFWESRSWKFFFINTCYHLASLLLVAFILVYMS